ncbi:MAG TPA: aminotransferase class V-fold PLP-dependent enzyme [Polyangiaceae bacterium]|nr:aminotransferase class V-fold PLP-dependent enzyme [Polyangiaceae bacterium]
MKTPPPITTTDSNDSERSPWASRWMLDPSIDFLNHGSFGACPTAVLEIQQHWRERLEREPVAFMLRELEGQLDAARASVAALLRADSDDLAFISNATTGVSTVLRSLDFARGDEILTTDHTYAACRNALDANATRAGATVVTARVPFPLCNSDEVVDAVLACVTPRTRLALLDHVTSTTGLVWPVERLVRALAERGVDALIDGAHAPGMIPVDLGSLGAAYYTANCHKWLCAPKGAAILHVRRDRQARVRPLVISHGAASPRRDRSRFRLEFDWTGTIDPSAWLCVPDAIQFLEGLLPGGLAALRDRNRAMALGARDVMAKALGVKAPAPDEMIGALATLPLPEATGEGQFPLHIDPLQDALFAQHRIEVPVFCWGPPRHRWIRVAAQAYNSDAQYRRLAAALVDLLRHEAAQPALRRTTLESTAILTSMEALTGSSGSAKTS